MLHRLGRALRARRHGSCRLVCGPIEIRAGALVAVAPAAAGGPRGRRPRSGAGAGRDRIVAEGRGLKPGLHRACVVGADALDRAYEQRQPETGKESGKQAANGNELARRPHGLKRRFGRRDDADIARGEIRALAGFARAGEECLINAAGGGGLALEFAQRDELHRLVHGAALGHRHLAGKFLLGLDGALQFGLRNWRRYGAVRR